MSNLERLIDRVCREQPVLGAPATLSARVIAEIERRAALPWWRQSFTHWPIPARAAFVAACAALTWTSLSAPMARVFSTVNEPLTWAYQTGASMSLINTVFGRVGANLASSVSPLWLYGAGLGICGLYVLFAGLCATTYRTLYIKTEQTARINI
jgi:hypothetical protein